MAVDLCKLGMRVGLAGRVGQDIFGQFVRDVLTAAGADTSLVRTLQTVKPAARW